MQVPLIRSMFPWRMPDAWDLKPQVRGLRDALQQVGYRIISVNPGHAEILGQKSYARLEGIPDPVEIVNVFRRSELVEPSSIQPSRSEPKWCGSKKEHRRLR